MSNIASLMQIGNVVQFNTYDTIDNVNTFQGEVIGLVSGRNHPMPETARIQHMNVYPSLPEAVKVLTPNDYRQYNYATVITETGSKITVGLPWIVESSLKIVVERGASIVLKNVEDADGERIRQVLTQAGYSVASVEFLTG